jgi:diaminopimelate epimerase
VQLVDDLENYNIKENGAAIRYGDLYGRLEAMSILSNK